MAKVAYEAITGSEEFDFDKLKAAVKELNESGLISKKVNIVGIKRLNMEAELTKRFLDAIEKIPEEDTQKMPDTVYEMNNTFIDILDGNDGKNGDNPEKIEKKKIEKKVGEKNKKEVTKKSNKLGVIVTIFNIIKDEGPINKDVILTKLAKKFIDRDPDKMKNTIQIQIGGKKRPLRMEREKKVKFEINEDNEYSLL